MRFLLTALTEAEGIASASVLPSCRVDRKTLPEILIRGRTMSRHSTTRPFRQAVPTHPTSSRLDPPACALHSLFALTSISSARNAVFSTATSGTPLMRQLRPRPWSTIGYGRCRQIAPSQSENRNKVYLAKESRYNRVATDGERERDREGGGPGEDGE